MENICIELAAFPLGSQVQSLKQSFLEIGCKIKEIDINKSPPVLNGTGRALKVVFLSTRNFPRKKLFEFLAKYKNIPCLGVFPCKEIERDRELLSQFSDFVNWPCNIQELSMRLERLYFDAEVKTGNDAGSAGCSTFIDTNLIGQSVVFRNTMRQISQIASYDAPALIEGDTGTGKELAARAIHYQSIRKDYPFIPVNCGALPDSLIENELFGHVKGAFTDARNTQTGLIAQAEGGTLFLDEVDSLTEKGQVVLLRFLQDFCYRPLGSEIVKQANVRVIVASNKSLAEYAQAQKFREDLFYRVNVLYTRIPPLRERREDILILARHFVGKLNKQYQLDGRELAPAQYKKLMEMDWPGNIRQLENFVQRELLMMSHSVDIVAESGGTYTDRRKRDYDWRINEIFSRPFNEAKEKVICRFEKDYLLRLMQETDGNVSRAARRSGKERRALGKLLKKHGINKYSVESPG